MRDAGAQRVRRQPEGPVLYPAVRAAWSVFALRVSAAGRAVPRFCEREAAAFLRCGILAHGFARVRCVDCGRDDVVAFSCKGRGFCASCGTRRMVDTAAFLVDRVIPEVAVRQWVLSLPYRVRVLCAYDADLCALVREVSGHYERAALRAGVVNPRAGAVAFVQRFDSGLRINVPPSRSKMSNGTCSRHCTCVTIRPAVAGKYVRRPEFACVRGRCDVDRMTERTAPKAPSCPRTQGSRPMRLLTVTFLSICQAVPSAELPAEAWAWSASAPIAAQASGESTETAEIPMAETSDLQSKSVAPATPPTTGSADTSLRATTSAIEAALRAEKPNGTVIVVVGADSAPKPRELSRHATDSDPGFFSAAGKALEHLLLELAIAAGLALGWVLLRHGQRKRVAATATTPTPILYFRTAGRPCVGNRVTNSVNASERLTDPLGRIVDAPKEWLRPGARLHVLMAGGSVVDVVVVLDADGLPLPFELPAA